MAITLTASAAPLPRIAPPAPRADALPSLPSSIADRYEEITLLGRGGMGAVYRARDRRLGRTVALKLLFDDCDGLRLLREARAQACIEHEHACKVHEVGVEAGTGYIAMQYIHGERLDVAAAAMTLEQKVRAIRQVSLALHEAHRLGLVHRDVKPSNILVEHREDGTFHPFLTDFGIAREVGAQGATVPGAIAGTPAFMAPEQALGEARALDRRTDVYGLGATAYAVLTGRPPFEASDPWALMSRILTDDARPIRRLVQDIPADLEAIIARCLDKAPGRRYPSARALADDLQRFLDGDPVEARRLSPGYLLFRAARRHRVRIGLAGAVVVAALAGAALWARDHRLATEHAALAQELGQDAKELEVFLIRAYELPLHDVEREKDVVRARLRDIEARMAVAGRAGAGPGHYALGRGHLALHEPAQARMHLAAAIAADYASPDLDYAMGLALGELYDRALVQARRIDNPAQQKARIDALAAEYATPAGQHLRAALAASFESPEYVEGLIELRAGRPEAALAKAEAALAKAPWLYEAKRLEGDAHFAIGSRSGHDAAFDFERMMVDYRAAAAAYRDAADIARSDPEVLEAECRLWSQIMQAATSRPDVLAASHDQAVAACGRAIAASSRSASPRIQQAFVEASYAWVIVANGATTALDPVIDAAIAHATEAMRLDSADPMGPYVVGLSTSARVYHLNHLGHDSRAAIDRAIAAYEGALRIDPTFTWALNDLASAYLDRATSERTSGLDPSASLSRVMALSARASELDPQFLNARGSEAMAHLFEAEHLLDTGSDPRPALARTRAAIDAGRTLGPDWSAAAYLSAYACWIEARYAVAVGADPSVPLARGETIAGAEAARAPTSAGGHEVLGMLATTRALHAFDRGADPGRALEVARVAFQRALALKPWDTGLVAWRARVEALRLRWTARNGPVAAERIRAAAAPLLMAIASSRVDPQPAQVLAELHEIRATSLVARGERADEDIAAGLANAAEALAMNPRMASALTAKSGLLLARARTEADPRKRADAAHAAVEALSTAVSDNPLLAHRTGGALAAASDLLFN